MHEIRAVPRDEFKKIAKDAIEQLTARAEAATKQALPRDYCFSWLAGEEIVAEGDVAEFLVTLTWVDETHISPCFDLFLESLRDDGRIQLRGYRAGYPTVSESVTSKRDCITLRV
jgi:hypothetical protein